MAECLDGRGRYAGYALQARLPPIDVAGTERKDLDGRVIRQRGDVGLLTEPLDQLEPPFVAMLGQPDDLPNTVRFIPNWRAIAVGPCPDL